MSHTRDLHDYLGLSGNLGSRTSWSKHFNVVMGEGHEVPLQLRDGALDKGGSEKLSK